MSRVLLALHRSATELPMTVFQEHVLDMLSETLPFDSAWWGMVSDLKIHTALAWCLPADYRSSWEQLKLKDPIAAAALASPRRTVIFNQRELAQDPEFNAFLANYGIGNVLCTVEPREKLNISHFLSLYRRRQGFSAEEAAFNQTIMPHLSLALSVNRLLHFDRMTRSSAASSVCVVIVDEEGLVHNADDSLRDLLLREWPNWNGPFLPQPLLERLCASGQYSSRNLAATSSHTSGLLVIHVRPGSLLNELTNRERDVATLYSEGATNKTIARQLGLSPATVRHYIRNVYSKFHITDKATLARLLAQDEMRVR